jgi:hypothetical protein
MRKSVLGAAIVAFAAGAVLLPGSAQAWWRGGFYGPGIVVVPGPVVYPPPPGYYPPPSGYYPAPPPGQTCYAGAYICPLDQPVPAGATCSCPTNQGRAYGQAR